MLEKESRMDKEVVIILLIFSVTALCIFPYEEALCSIDSPQMVMDERGNIYVVWTGWQESVSNNGNIYWMRVDASGNPGAVKMISTHPDNTMMANEVPQIAVDASGNSYVVWKGSDGNDDEIYWVRIDASGNPGMVKKISTHKDNAENDDGFQQIATDLMGNSYVVWRGWLIRNEISEIYWVRIDASGNPGEVERIHCESNYGIPYIVVDVSGNSYVVWGGNDGNDYEIYWVKVDASGSPGDVKKISTHKDNEETDDFDPHIALDVSGNSYVVWKGCFGGSCWNAVGNYEIYWVKVDASGNPGEVKKISTRKDNEGHHNYAPQIAVDTVGNSHVVWFCKGNHSYEIYWVGVDASGNPGKVKKISTYEESEIFDDFDPHIAVDASGNSYVIWESGPLSGDEYYLCNICWIKIDTMGNFAETKKIFSCC